MQKTTFDLTYNVVLCWRALNRWLESYFATTRCDARWGYATKNTACKILKEVTDITKKTAMYLLRYGPPGQDLRHIASVNTVNILKGGDSLWIVAKTGIGF